MRLLNLDKKYYCGIDLHGKTMYTTIMDKSGTLLFHKNLPNSMSDLLDALRPYQKDVAVGVESTFNWYWLADGCKRENIPFYLGHALYMKAVHGGKNKNDSLDSKHITDLLRSNLFPLAYSYPPEMRAVRDLLRRRRHYVDIRSAAYRHIQMVYMQQGIVDRKLPAPNIKGKRESMMQPFEDPNVCLAVASDIRQMNVLDDLINVLESKVLDQAKKHDRTALNLLETIPGVGAILAYTLLYEIHTISRFPSPQAFSSYCRLVKPERSSGGKTVGAGNGKIGNPHLKWAFTQIIVHAQLYSPVLKRSYERMKQKHGLAKSKSIIGHKFAIAVYHMLKNGKAFDENKFIGG
ncbi:MAG: family transposase [Fibrobacteres bacterium]|nr:family transposase [Fibrobacterota bacterium]